MMRPRSRPSRLLGLLCALSFAGRGVEAQEGSEEVIRPLDRITLKNGNVLEGELALPLDRTPAEDEVVELVSRGGTTKIAVRGGEIRAIERRRTAEDVYTSWRKRIGKLTDPSEHAREELRLGSWCRTPCLELAGAAPRADAALTHVLRALELDPALKEGYPLALDLLAEAGGERPEDAYVRLATWAREAGVSCPEAHYRAALTLLETPGLEAVAQTELEVALASKDWSPGLAREARRRLAETLVRGGRLEAALELYRPFLEGAPAGPEAFDALLEMARIQMRSGDPALLASARELLTRAKGLQPEVVEVDAELAALEYRAGNPALAEKLLKGLLARDNANAEVAVDLALSQARQGKAKAARKALVALPAGLEPALAARARLALALCDGVEGKLGPMIDGLRAAVELDPASADARIALATGLLQAGHVDEAQKVCEALLPEAARNRWLFGAVSRVLGEAHLLSGDAEQAVRHLTRAAAVETSDPILLERLAYALLEVSRGEEALAQLRQAESLAPDRIDTLTSLAYYHYQRDDTAEARKLFDRVLKLLPQARKGAPQDSPVEARRRYALSGRALIDDRKRLEVWSADFAGADASRLDGWEEVERSGVEIARRGAVAVVGAEREVAPEGITMALLERGVDTRTFERVAMTARILRGPARVALRLEGTSGATKASAGIIVYCDYDGVIRCQTKSSRGDWQALEKATEERSETGRTVFSETAAWPQDGGPHTLEIRRAARGEKTRTATAFDLLIDGRSVAENVRVAGLGGQSYQVGFSGQADARGQPYQFEVREFRVFRARPEVEKNAKY